MCSHLEPAAQPAQECDGEGTAPGHGVGAIQQQGASQEQGRAYAEQEAGLPLAMALLPEGAGELLKLVLLALGLLQGIVEQIR